MSLGVSAPMGTPQRQPCRRRSRRTLSFRSSITRNNSASVSQEAHREQGQQVLEVALADTVVPTESMPYRRARGSPDVCGDLWRL